MLTLRKLDVTVKRLRGVDFTETGRPTLRVSLGTLVLTCEGDDEPVGSFYETFEVDCVYQFRELKFEALDDRGHPFASTTFAVADIQNHDDLRYSGSLEMTPVGKLKVEIVGSEGQMDPQDQGLYLVKPASMSGPLDVSNPNGKLLAPYVSVPAENSLFKEWAEDADEDAVDIRKIFGSIYWSKVDKPDTRVPLYLASDYPEAPGGYPAKAAPQAPQAARSTNVKSPSSARRSRPEAKVRPLQKLLLRIRENVQEVLGFEDVSRGSRTRR